MSQSRSDVREYANEGDQRLQRELRHTPSIRGSFHLAIVVLSHDAKLSSLASSLLPS